MKYKFKMLFVCLVTLVGLNAWADVSPGNILVNVEKNGKWTYEVADLKTDDEAALLYKLVNEAINIAPDSIGVVTPNGEVNVDLKKIMEQLSYVVNHGHRFTKMFSGWGPEDDFEYEYPNREFYHPINNRKGKIKVNVTEKAMQIVKLGDELGAHDKNISNGAHQYAIGLILHEALHAAQYSVYPVRSFSDTPKSIVDGLMVDPKILDGTKQKISYEVAAMRQDRLVEQKLGVDKKSKFLTTAIKFRSDDANAVLFRSADSKYGLVRLSHLQGYLEDCKQAKKLLNKPISEADVFANEANDVLYNSEYKPVEVVYRLHNINESVGKGRSERTPAIVSEVDELKKTWTRYMESGMDVTKSWSYLKEVKVRYEKELAKFEG